MRKAAMLLLSLAMLAATACAAEPTPAPQNTPAPTLDIAATIEAHIEATIAAMPASTPTPAPTNTPAPTPDIEATIAHRIEAALAATPTPPPAPAIMLGLPTLGPAPTQQELRRTIGRFYDCIQTNPDLMEHMTSPSISELPDETEAGIMGLLLEDREFFILMMSMGLLQDEDTRTLLRIIELALEAESCP